MNGSTRQRRMLDRFVQVDELPDARRYRVGAGAAASWIIRSRGPGILVGVTTLGPGISVKAATSLLIAHDDHLQPIRGQPVVERTAEECPA